jgi:glycogen operon protein
LRQEHPVFRREAFLTGREVRGSGLPDVWWFRPDGRRMTQRDWQADYAHTLGVFLNGREIADRTSRGEPIEDDSFLLLFNAHYEDMTFTLPARRFGGVWAHELSTHDPKLEPDAERHASRDTVDVPSRSLRLLRRVS